MNETIENTNKKEYKHEYYIRGILVLILLMMILMSQCETMLLLMSKSQTTRLLGLVITAIPFYSFLGLVVYKIVSQYKHVPKAVRLTDKYLEIIYDGDVKQINWDQIRDCTPSRPWIIRLKNGEKLDLKTVDREITQRVYTVWRDKKSNL